MIDLDRVDEVCEIFAIEERVVKRYLLHENDSLWIDLFHNLNFQECEHVVKKSIWVGFDFDVHLYDGLKFDIIVIVVISCILATPTSDMLLFPWFVYHLKVNKRDNTFTVRLICKRARQNFYS